MYSSYTISLIVAGRSAQNALTFSRLVPNEKEGSHVVMVVVFDFEVPNPARKTFSCSPTIFPTWESEPSYP